ncbi:restriction endonuclease subunit S [uncultured Prevotella sp.]|uniref:restriction endonuclease subunit S n=1 Tax=uncultured Prevotella sp. TaxID=159272 RepID=UPI00261B2676|nr:restriction endonuclease subunit S [uncultured Prevotella sp.]
MGEISNYGTTINIQVDDIDKNEWILELEDIEKETANIIQRLSASERSVKGTRHKFSAGSILYSKLRTYLNKVLVAPSEGYCTTEIMPFDTYGIISNEYICHVLRSPFFLDYTLQCGYGVKMPRLSTTDACNGMIPLPPLNEQIRIVEAIKYWFVLIDIIESGKENLQETIKQAKSKILDLAIHGKLVPQDPTDEPASKLLKRINPKAEITSDNGHYQKLPEGWCETTLKHVLTIKSGNSINVRNCTQGLYPIYGGNGITGHTDDYNIKESTIVIGRVGYYCGSVYLVRGKAWVSDNAFITTIHKDIFYKKYLYYLLQFLNLRKFSNSTAQPVISGKTIYPIHVLIPPIREQKRIVAKIEEIFAHLNAIEASL